MKRKSLLCIILVAFLALALIPGQAGAAKEWMITFATASPGGTLMMASSVWASFLMKKIPGLNITVESTGGGIADVRLIEAKEADMGWGPSSTLYEARHGLAWAKGKKYTRARILLPWYKGTTPTWTLGDLKIDKLEDINGKIFSPGPSGGPADTVWRLTLDLFGIKPKKFINASWGDVLGQQKDGLIDIASVSTISPWPSLKNLELTHKVNFFFLTEEQVKKFCEKYPWYFPNKDLAGIYKNLKEDGHSVGWFSPVNVSPEFDPDLAYKIIKVTFEGKKELEKIMGVYAKQLDPSMIELANQAPIHPGAVRFYKEKGFKILKTLP